MNDKELEKLFISEFKSNIKNLIWQNANGDYELFDRYQIIIEKPIYRVFNRDTEIGIFHSTKTALSWCIADKYKKYNLARDIMALDNKLNLLTTDIKIRSNVAERSKNNNFRDLVVAKLETKIIHKKQVELQLNKCVNWAKYCQQRGFNNETVRTSINQTVKASR